MPFVLPALLPVCAAFFSSCSLFFPPSLFEETIGWLIFEFYSISWQTVPSFPFLTDTISSGMGPSFWNFFFLLPVDQQLQLSLSRRSFPRFGLKSGFESPLFVTPYLSFFLL